ncbi:hypothetical protein V3589_11080 [Sinorhizobium fredii]|uniref:hypothetical protein n=1 Tax=Rhizobium fredii TaxID=380 RepID=UPI00309C9C70
MNSVRHEILNAMVSAYRAVDQPGWPIKFSVVGLGPLADADHTKRFSIGVVAGPESQSYVFPYIQSTLQVGIEFRITVNRGDAKPGVLAEELLTVVKRVLIDNRTWGGRAIDTKITGAEIDMTTYGDRTIMGVCFCEVLYRHSHLDPRNPNPDA